MPIISIPGIGEVEFPDNMSNEEISSVIKNQYFSGSGQQQINSIFQQPTQDATSESLGMFSPTQAAKGAQMVAPEIGMTAGGLLGSKIPYPGAAPFMTGLGYAGGEAIKQGEIPSLDQFTQNFGKGAAMELGVKPLSWLTEKAIKPITEGFQMLRAGQLAQKGLPVPANIINPTETGMALAKKARETYPGNKMVENAHEKLKNGAKEMLDELSAKYNLYEQNPKGLADKAFDAWAEAMGGNKSAVQVDTAVSKIKEFLNDPVITNANPKDKMANWWKQQASSFAENPTLQGLRDIWSTITTKSAKGADKTARMDLLAAIQQDLETIYGGEIVDLLNLARDKNLWAKQTNILKSVIDKSMSKEKGLQFNPDVFSYEWNRIISSPKASYFNQSQLAELSQFSDMMGVIGSELQQKVSNKGAESLLAGIGGAGLASYLGLPKSASIGLAALNPALSYRAGQIYNPSSRLYQKMLGNPSSELRQQLPGLVNIGGKLMLLEGNKLIEGNQNE
jgi:hypothetical protein